jgi:ABC-type sugar transport system ATPase subunit
MDQQTNYFQGSKMMFLTLQNIEKSFGGQPVLKGVNLSLEAHQTVSILGRSGCGKSTLLKIVAGIEPPDGGQIILKEKNITDTKPQARNIVYLFQEALLFPNLNAFENIAFGLRIRKVSDATVKQRVAEMMESLELEEHRAKMPHQLSGGQKQRVAFGRALIIQPPLILLDEPFSSLDVEIRSSMQELYKRVAKQYRLTALFVTHDLKEALIMGDVMSYMEAGRLQVYLSKEDFMKDEKTGVRKEIDFWNELK